MPIPGYAVNCMMCGERIGVIRQGVFYRDKNTPPLKNRDGRTHCRKCSGNLYREPLSLIDLIEPMR